MCSLDHGFYRLDRSLALSSRKVCTSILLIACTFRKRLCRLIKSSNCALRLALFSFSLRCCKASNTYSKTIAKTKIVVPKRYTLHTVSTQTRLFDNNFRKTILARTRVQSVRVECTFTEVVYGFLMRGCFGTVGLLCADVGYFL